MSIVDTFFEIGKGFVYGSVAFWNWFTNPIIVLGDLVIAPYMILSFAALMVVFGMVLIHLINPVG